ncbi:MAG: hypothetical protein ABIH59_00425 [archaeon]
MDKEIYNKIIQKKEFSKLVKKDIEMAFNHFEKRQVSDAEKIRLTRELLHKVFSSFTSQKLLSIKDKDVSWVLRKHLSTRERLPYYKEVYLKILKNFKGTVFDLGAGINGFSYGFFPKGIYYVCVEAVGQLVDLMNYYFKTKGLEAMAIHDSLFNLDKIKKYMKQVKGEKIVFLFKTLDSLEMLERDYSKKILTEIIPLVDCVVVSFATKSMVSRKKFKVKRNWIFDFIKEKFTILEDFEVGDEKFIIFSK